MPYFLGESGSGMGSGLGSGLGSGRGSGNSLGKFKLWLLCSSEKFRMQMSWEGGRARQDRVS